MIFEGFVGLWLIHIRVAVYAGVWAGIVRADVRAFCAAALVSCRLIAVNEAGRGK